MISISESVHRLKFLMIDEIGEHMSPDEDWHNFDSGRFRTISAIRINSKLSIGAVHE